MRLREMTIRLRHTDEGGFSLIEAMAAIVVMAVVLLALSASMITSFRALRTTKEVQQAVGVGAEAIEWAKSVNYDSLSMVDTDSSIPTDSRMTSCTAPTGYTYAFDPDGSGTKFSCEPVVSSASGGALTTHKTQETVGEQTFTVSRYVTWHNLDGGDAKDVKRFTVIVEWNAGGPDRTYRTSSVISKARKGLPTPSFTLTPLKKTLAVEPGNVVVFQHTIQNLGILDRYEVAMPVPVGRSWSIKFYKDVNGNNVYDGPSVDEFGTPIAAIDTELTDTDGNGSKDTGNLTTNSYFKFFAVWTLNAAEVEPLGTETLNLTISSNIDGTVQKVAEDKLKVGSAELLMYLHDYPWPPVADVISEKGLPMVEDEPPTGSTLYRYSTNYYTGGTGGRWVEKGGNKDSTDGRKFVNWVYMLPETTVFNGTAKIRIWATNQPGGDCDDKIRVKAALRTKDSAITDSKIADLGETEVSYDPPDGAACEWHQFDINIPMSNKTIQQNQWLELKVFHPGDDNQVIFGYDTTTFPAYLNMPQVLT
jgi:type II secretory pathway pseudopilin PulG